MPFRPNLPGPGPLVQARRQSKAVFPLAWSWLGVFSGSASAADPQYPSTVNEGDAIFMFIVNKATSGTGDPPTIVTAAGWSEVHTAVGGIATDPTPGDAGLVRTTLWKRDLDADGNEGGILLTDIVVNPAGSSHVHTVMFGLTHIDPLSASVSSGSDATAGTDFSVTTSADPGIKTGDLLIALGGWSVSTTSGGSAESITVPGATVSATTEVIDASTTSGNDDRLMAWWGVCTAGASTGAPTIAATSAAATQHGVGTVLRVRESATDQEFTRSDSGTATDTAVVDDGGLLLTAGTPAFSTTSVTTLNVDLPTRVAGDYCILVCGLNVSSGAITPPAGWSNILANTDTTIGSTSGHHAIYYRKWVPGDPDTVAVTCASGRICVLPVRVERADPTTFIEVAASVTQDAAADTSVIAPTITSSASTVMLYTMMGRNAAAGTLITWAPPAGDIEIGEATSQDAAATNAGVSLNRSAITPGVASGTRTGTSNVTITGGMGVSFALTLAAAAATPITASDSATGADTSALTADLPVTDTAVGTDTSVLTAALATVTETAVGADASALTAAIPVTDTATGVDTAPTLGKTVTDTAVGADASATTAVLTATDTAVGAESIPTFAQATTDAAVATDTAALLAGNVLTANDSATSTDVVTGRALALTDSATTADVAALDTGLIDGFEDESFQTDAFQSRPSLPGTAAITSLLGSLTQAATATTNIGVFASDTATATEAVSGRGIAVPDTAIAADMAPTLAKPGTDSATSSDVVADRVIAVTDAAAGADTSALAAALATVTDSATAVESIPTLAKATTDAASANDVASALTAALAASDSAVATDASLVPDAALPVFDSVTAADAAVMTNVPQNLIAVAVSTNEIDLTWDVFVGAVAYDIERDGAIIAFDVPDNAYDDIGLSPNTLYTYRVRAVV